MVKIHLNLYSRNSMNDIKDKNSNISESSLVQEELLQFPEKECEEACGCTEALSIAEEIETIDEPSEELAKERKHHPHLDSFMQEIEKMSQPDAKLKHSLVFMENSLAQSGTPHFKSFWEVRNICLQLFKENLPPALRAQFWTKYSELSKEARRLKEILDEQSSFAVEQIEMAIAALETDIDHFEEQLVKMETPDLSGMPNKLTKKLSTYEDIQKRLNLLNVQASRINAMRKELIKTEMRIRQKNKFFQRLSQAGDKIFPLRKDLIKEVSTVFNEDVDDFIHVHFNEDFHDNLFVLREEIKGLQGLAKVLTLNTQAFTHTRMRLSECWDKIKVAEKERKKERAQLKACFKQNFEAVQQKIQEYKNRYEAGELSDDQAHKQLDDISKFMRQVDLGREEIKVLRDELSLSRNQLLDKAKAQEQARLQQEQEREMQRKSKIDELKNEIQLLGEKISVLNSQELLSARDELLEKIQNVPLSKFEKQEIERLLKPLRSLITDALSEKEEQAILSLSEDERQAIDQLREVLKQRKERRQEIKNQLEALRKSNGFSSFDIEKAMNHNELVKSERERLEKINQGIKEIEDKIAQLQKKR
jgi:hypothetical protein